MIEERYKLAAGRIREMKKEDTAAELFRHYFRTMADFVIMIDELNREIAAGAYRQEELSELKEWNYRLYEDILPENYEHSYANPSYAVSKFGKDYGQLLSFLYTELRGTIVYAFEQKTEYLTVLFELLVEVYNKFEEVKEPDIKVLNEIIYWYASDYCDVFAADRIKEQLDPAEDFAVDIIMNCDLEDISYLYQFGEYISKNEIETARHMLKLPETEIKKMADVFTEGYRMGFINTGKDLSKKSVVNIRYVLGFERVVREAVLNFEQMGLKPVIYRASVSALTKRQHLKTGYYGGIPNKQYDYDHRNDQGLFLDKQYIERKLEVMKTTYEQYKDSASGFAGPACMDVFGEEPFSPVQKDEAVTLTDKQEELSLQYDGKSSQLTNAYIPGDERSFTIIAYPLPEIGENYKEIFDDIIRINTLDAKVYEEVQQTIIDVLDKGKSVHILGGNGNRTDLRVQLYKLKNSEKETIFENCVADVNIPVGEVFTSPVLEETNGILHVSRVYLNELQYKDLEITFANGMIADYNCKNFERELDNKNIYRKISFTIIPLFRWENLQSGRTQPLM